MKILKFQLVFLAAALISLPSLNAQKKKPLEILSPEGSILLRVETTPKLQWSVFHKGQEIIAASPISVTLQSGEVLGENARIARQKTEKINTSFNAINYRKAVVQDVCTQVTLSFRGDYGIIFRVYDDAAAYRFFTNRPGDITVSEEEASFNFTADHQAFIPIQWDYRDGKIFNSSFEATYREISLSQFPKDSLAFLPVLVDAGQGKKALILEADLENYPGMYLDLNATGKGLMGVFAPYPIETYVQGINIIPIRRAGYIARTDGTRSFPWRAVAISENDRELLDCDIVQKLASPNRLGDVSWIKPGQVAWDWWSNMNISHVDFRAGMNTPSYKYYIDFAARYGIPYILLDGGWNVPGDLTKARTEIDLDELVAYGKLKGVGIIVWCSWKDVLAQKDKAFPYYERQG